MLDNPMSVADTEVELASELARYYFEVGVFVMFKINRQISSKEAVIAVSTKNEPIIYNN